MQARTFNVRDWPKVVQKSQDPPQNVFRVYFSDNALSALNLEVGRLCKMQRKSSPPVYAEAWSHPAGEKINENVVRCSSFLRKIYALKYNESVSISPCPKPINEAQSVTLKEVNTSNKNGSTCEVSTPLENLYWIGAVRGWLYNVGFVYSSLILEDFEYFGNVKSFALYIESVGTEDLTLYKLSPRTVFQFFSLEDPPLSNRSQPARRLRISEDRLGGFGRQVEKINRILRWYDSDKQSMDGVATLQLRAGIILHGSTGTGKSLLLKSISEGPWNRVITINDMTIGGKGRHLQEALNSLVQDALNDQPSVVLIDDLHSVIANRDVEDVMSSRRLQLLCRALERTRIARVLLVAATNDLQRIHPSLRAFFSQAIYLHAPDPMARREILKIACDLPKAATSEILDKIGDNTHGFSPLDLVQLVETCTLEAGHVDTLKGSFPSPDLQWRDVQPIVQKVRPAILDSVSIERPQVCWADVGGNDQVRGILEQAIEWPERYHERMENLHVGAIKGVLLYGPPGCSKTLVAKALASSSTWNFIPVRGPELLRMYVGESERAVRNLFEVARAAAPSIIFFDEIDALGLSRGLDGRVGGPQTNVLTTLLTELDGIEPLSNVFVLAATNAPEDLDPALIRAGRLEHRIYMGLPDEDTCRSILLLHKSRWAEDVDLKDLTRKAIGYTGAEIVRMVQQAGRLALAEALKCDRSQHEDKIEMRHFHQALDEVKRDVTADMLQRYSSFQYQI